MSDPRILDTDSIIASAHIATGLSDMVDDALRTRVDALAGYFRESGPYSDDQEIATRRQLVKLVSRRIAIAGDIAKHPEILEEEIEDPIFVVGFMRTGTSIMQALLATDPANRGVVAWQTREPSPAPGECPVGPFRRKLAAEEVFRFVERSQGLITLHPYWDEWEKTLIEDDEIVALDFRNSYPTFLYDAPSLGYMFIDDDDEGRYRFIKLFLQHQQWNMPKRRWVMKGVDHQTYISTLLKVFPDARMARQSCQPLGPLWQAQIHLRALRCRMGESKPGLRKLSRQVSATRLTSAWFGQRERIDECDHPRLNREGNAGSQARNAGRTSRADRASQAQLHGKARSLNPDRMHRQTANKWKCEGVPSGKTGRQSGHHYRRRAGRRSGHRAGICR